MPFRKLLAFFVAALLTGCASLPPPEPRAPEHALQNVDGTRLAKAVATSKSGQAFQSGFRLVVSGEDAFGSLAALADSAERTLDLQYYIVENDDSGRALLERVRAAADRGVKVRLLLDDLNTSGEDGRLLHLTQHPNIEVRLYNPFPAGRFSTVARVAASLHDFRRINHRMHIKMFVADNVLAVTGGRNLGDAYFLHSASSNFVDLDVIVAGKAVRSLSSAFDRFWNDPLAYPVGQVASSSPPPAPSTPKSATASRPRSSEDAAQPAFDAQAAIKQNRLAHEIAAGRIGLTWARASVIADKPLDPDSVGDATQPVADNVADLMSSVRQEVKIISPYFVPGREGLALFSGLAQRGVKVSVLTNSLATTDAPAVHIGYSRYRVALLETGAQIYELRPRLDESNARIARIGRFGSSQAKLHAKGVVLDRQVVIIGSMNMDPRSARLNSEIGLVIRSSELAQQLSQLFDDVARDGSYHVELDADHHLQWSAALPVERPPAGALASGAEAPAETGRVVLHDEPEASAWRKFTLMLLSPFAPEEML